MSLPTSVAEVIQRHVTLTVECVDRLYLNVIQPRLQVERGIAYFFRHHRSELFATGKTMAEVTRPFDGAAEAAAAGAWGSGCAGAGGGRRAGGGAGGAAPG